MEFADEVLTCGAEVLAGYPSSVLKSVADESSTSRVCSSQYHHSKGIGMLFW
jgi:hypothetical protein